MVGILRQALAAWAGSEIVSRKRLGINLRSTCSSGARSAPSRDRLRSQTVDMEVSWKLSDYCLLERHCFPQGCGRGAPFIARNLRRPPRNKSARRVFRTEANGLTSLSKTSITLTARANSEGRYELGSGPPPARGPGSRGPKGPGTASKKAAVAWNKAPGTAVTVLVRCAGRPR